MKLDDAERLGPLRHADTLSDRAADVLREHILGGDFGLGERLVEASIARQLQISRGPVREALKRLGAEGLVREEPGRGTFVVDLTVEDIQEIYELRAAIEAEAVRLIVSRRDGDALAELRRILEQLGRAAEEGDRERFVRLDLSFHEGLCRLSGNSRLHRVCVSYVAILGMVFRLEVNRIYASLEDLLREHELLLEEIESLDARRAEGACRKHLHRARERLIEEFRSSLAANDYAPSGRATS